MPPLPTDNADPILIERWSLSAAATLGSSVRARGILLEIRARVPSTAKKALDLKGGELILTMLAARDAEFRSVLAVVADTLVGIESMPVIPREIEDILSISTTERHRWLKDGRLPSAGTRTVKLRGRAKQITFHVFDPRLIEDLLDRDLVDTWREEDAITAAENRRKAIWKAKLSRAQQSSATTKTEESHDDAAKPALLGWDEFERTGLLR